MRGDKGRAIRMITGHGMGRGAVKGYVGVLGREGEKEEQLWR